MTLYSYTVATDSGFAPNPFYESCTLACCKPGIRRTAQQGDYVVGIGPKGSGNLLVYAMRVTETVEFDDYWHDSRFRKKRPDIEAGGKQALGDNIYRLDRAGKWLQAPSQHSHGNEQDLEMMRRDISGQKVLIGDDFIYWGGDGPLLPQNLRGLIAERYYRSRSNDGYIPDFIQWFESQQKGLVGLPTEGIPSPCKRRQVKRKKCC